MEPREIPRKKPDAAKGRPPRSRSPLVETSAEVTHLLLDSSKSCICLGEVAHPEPKFGNFRLLAIECSTLFSEITKPKSMANPHIWNGASPDQSLVSRVVIPVGTGRIDFTLSWAPDTSNDQEVSEVRLVLKGNGGQTIKNLKAHKIDEECIRFDFKMSLLDYKKLSTIEVYATIVQKQE